jgi:hypothetical protein
MPTLLLDGRYSQGFYSGRPRVDYPFQGNADVATKVIAREFRRSLAQYLPAVVGYERDPKWSDARLMAEGAPVPLNIGDVIAAQRTFANVPPDQVTFGSRVITKPTAAGTGGISNAAYILDSDMAGTSNLGLWHALLGYIWTPDNRVFGPPVATTSADNSANTRVTFASPHGIAGTEVLICLRDVTGYRYGVAAPTTGYTVVNATTIDFLGVNIGAYATSVAKYLRDYSPGSDRVGCRFTQRFYLPGVTTSITTAADIPMPAVLVNDADFLAAVVANLTGYLTYDADELTRWNGWPIYTQTFTEINMANV